VSSADSSADPVRIAEGLWARTAPGCLALTGEVDLNTERAMRMVVAAHTSAEPGPFVLDLTGLAYLDSAGIGTIYALARDPDLTFSVRVRAGSMIDRLLDFSGVERILHVERVPAV
jgi:anti-anti-sigma factor